MMRQYWDIKSLHPDKIILYRMGDFYEMFFDDAVQAAPLLGITLTKRNKKSQDETPMCGVPYHSISGPINKLLSSGLKVAICDQLEDPKFAKGIVKRGVTRVLTPGMVFDPECLDVASAYYMAAVGSTDLACLDASTGEAFYYLDLKKEEVLRLKSLLPIVEEVPYQQAALQSLQEYFFSVATEEQKLILKPFEKRSLHKVLELSKRTVEHLELFQSYSKTEVGSLFSVIDRTKTACAKRRLKSWVRFPLADRQEVLNRQAKIKELAKDVDFLKAIREQLAGLLDIERKFAKLSSPSSTPLDLRGLAVTLSDALQVADSAKKYFQFLAQPSLQEVCAQVLQAIIDEPPVALKNGGFIRAGFNKEKVNNE
jgi:DNA mismatch repair protein MutS